MKKMLVTFTVLISVFLLSACNNAEELSGKTIKLAPIPVLEENIDNPSSYKPIMVLSFSDDNVVTNTIKDQEGTYKFDDDVLVVNFKNENEKLKIKFSEFEKSDKDFIMYSTSISDVEFQIENSEQVVSHFQRLASDLDKGMPLAVIEK